MIDHAHTQFASLISSLSHPLPLFQFLPSIVLHFGEILTTFHSYHGLQPPSALVQTENCKHLFSLICFLVYLSSSDPLVFALQVRGRYAALITSSVLLSISLSCSLLHFSSPTHQSILDYSHSFISILDSGCAF